MANRTKAFSTFLNYVFAIAFAFILILFSVLLNNLRGEIERRDTVQKQVCAQVVDLVAKIEQKDPKYEEVYDSLVYKVCEELK